MKRLLASLIVSALVLLVGTSLVSAADYTVGVAVIGLEHHWDINAFNGAMDGLKALGAEAIGLDGERKAQKHIDNLETLLQMKPDAIIIVLGYSELLDPVMGKITKAGIPIVTCDFPTSFSSANVASSNELMGTMIAQKMADDLGGKGNIVSFYRPGSPIAEVRHNMLLKVLEKYPDIHIVAEQPYVTPGTVPHAMSVMEGLMTKYPRKGDIDAVWSLFDQPVIGAAMAVEAAGRQGEIKLYGIDGDPKALELLKRGTYTATVLQQPYEIGKKAAEVALELAKGGKVEKEIFIEAQLITEENVDQYVGK